MKKTLVKLISAILCALMLLSFAACSGNNKETTTISVKQADVSKPGDGKKIYFAGPLFNQGEKDFNLKITNVLEEYGYTVFLPQRDGIEAALLEGKTEEELTEMIFAKDISELMKSDIVFINIDGRTPDEGACVELGIGYTSGKRCYGFKTDTRSVETSIEVNPMITGCLIRLFKNYSGDELIKELRDYLSKNAL